MKAAERLLLMPAYVLHQYNWRETSRVVELFSRDHGRLGVVARGARRARSPWRAALRPFQPLLVSWSGGGELATLIGAESAAAAPALSGTALMSGFYLNELLLRLLPRHDPQPGLYAYYTRTLERLMVSAAPALRLFEKNLLAALGYGLNLECDAATGEPLQSDCRYLYAPERGPLTTNGAAGPGLNVSGATLLALAEENLEQVEQLREAQRLLRAMLDSLLGERPLKTREVMRAFGRATG